MSTINDASTVDMRELQILLKSSEEMYVDFSKEKEKMLEVNLSTSQFVTRLVSTQCCGSYFTSIQQM